MIAREFLLPKLGFLRRQESMEYRLRPLSTNEGPNGLLFGIMSVMELP